MVKMVAVTRVWKFEPGQEFEVTEAEARALEALGSAKRVDVQSAQTHRRSPGRPPKAQSESSAQTAETSPSQ